MQDWHKIDVPLADIISIYQRLKELDMKTISECLSKDPHEWIQSSIQMHNIKEVCHAEAEKQVQAFFLESISSNDPIVTFEDITKISKEASASASSRYCHDPYQAIISGIAINSRANL